MHCFSVAIAMCAHGTIAVGPVCNDEYFSISMQMPQCSQALPTFWLFAVPWHVRSINSRTRLVTKTWTHIEVCKYMTSFHRTIQVG